MKVAIINDFSESNRTRKESTEKYIKILEHNKIDHVLLSVSDLEFFQKITDFTHVIFRWSQFDDSKQAAKAILPVLENGLGLKCFPNQKTCWHYDDKIRQSFLMKAKGLPMTESWIFYDKVKALGFVKKTEYPIIFKLYGGAGSVNVVMVKALSQAEKLVKKMFGKGILPNKVPGDIVKKRDFKLIKWLKITIGDKILPMLKGVDPSRYWLKHKNYVYFQKFLPNNDFDTRVTVIGGKAFAFRRFNRENDFRSSGSGKIDHDKTKIDMDFIKLAQKVSKEMGFQSMAYDMLRNEKGDPEFCEISYTYQDKAVYNCFGYWDEDLNWHEGHFWPPYLHLKDLLGMDLKQPEI